MVKNLIAIATVLSFVFAVSFTASYGWELGFQAAIAGKVLG